MGDKRENQKEPPKNTLGMNWGGGGGGGVSCMSCNHAKTMKGGRHKKRNIIQKLNKTAEWKGNQTGRQGRLN